jgi:hypothetical protein
MRFLFSLSPLLCLPFLLTPLFGCQQPLLASAARAEAADGTGAAEATALSEWVAPFREARFSRQEQYDSLPVDIGKFRVSFGPEILEQNRSLWERCESRLGGKGLSGADRVDCVLVFLGVDGFGNAASPISGVSPRQWDWWSPPQVILPAQPVVGARWEQAHFKRGKWSRRQCELRADAAFCDDGIESRCYSEFESSAVVISEHYCKGLGWVGENAFARYVDGHRYSSFTYDLVVDGVAMPARRDGAGKGDANFGAAGGSAVYAR